MESGKDVTVVVKDGVANGVKQLDLGIRLDPDNRVVDLAVDYCAGPEYVASMGMFVMRRDMLIHYVKESVARSRYRFERDFLLKQFGDRNITVGVYPFAGVAPVQREHPGILPEQPGPDGCRRAPRPVPGRPHHLHPGSGPGAHHLGVDAQIDDCIVADGCRLEGKAEHSVFFRQVKLEEGARVKDCVIMNDCVVGQGAELYCVILDKDVVVRPGVRLIGTPENPIMVKRG